MFNFLNSLIDLELSDVYRTVSCLHSDLVVGIVQNEFPYISPSEYNKIKSAPNRIEISLYNDAGVNRVHSATLYQKDMAIEKVCKKYPYVLPKNDVRTILLNTIKDRVLDYRKKEIPLYGYPWNSDENGYDSEKIAKELGYIEDLLIKGFPDIPRYNIKNNWANSDIARFIYNRVDKRYIRLLYDIYTRMKLKIEEKYENEDDEDGDYMYVYEYTNGNNAIFAFPEKASDTSAEYIREAFKDIVAINNFSC